jgi:hypothetical protein
VTAWQVLHHIHIAKHLLVNIQLLEILDKYSTTIFICCTTFYAQLSTRDKKSILFHKEKEMVRISYNSLFWNDRGVLVIWYSYNIVFWFYDIPTIMIPIVTTHHHLSNRSLTSTDIQLKTNDKTPHSKYSHKTAV